MKREPLNVRAGHQKRQEAHVAVELTTMVRVDGARPVPYDVLVEKLDDAVRRAIADLGMAGITAYFVAPDLDVEGFRVGLRFEGMDPEFIEETADDVLSKAFALANGDASGKPAREVQRVRSQLVSA
ncbi:hypothetical protein ACFY9N_01150 [Microbacterium sp. NPDC008134]|uniref:hypothetical protein n=1 Tax=Microbacterium sp. NPDC008134 TaxID=3364183 RepID=UPI0036EE8DF4